MQIKTKVDANAWMHVLYCKIPLCQNALQLAIIIGVTGNAVFGPVYPLCDPALSSVRGSDSLSDSS